MVAALEKGRLSIRRTVVVSPLAYQLDPEYPFLPQAQFARYCEERSLACLDLLPMLRDKRADKPFFDEVDYGAPRGREVL